MNPISTEATVQRAIDGVAIAKADKASPETLTVRQAFQEFVAGTFYTQMLKSMRKMHDKPAYFHGGQAEEIFQSQLDQQVAEDLARDQGAAFADPLFQAFSRQVRGVHFPASAPAAASAYAASAAQSMPPAD